MWYSKWSTQSMFCGGLKSWSDSNVVWTWFHSETKVGAEIQILPCNIFNPQPMEQCGEKDKHLQTCKSIAQTSSLPHAEDENLLCQLFVEDSIGSQEAFWAKCVWVTPKIAGTRQIKVNKAITQKKKKVMVVGTTYISWLTWYWLMKTHVSLGMKYPFRVMFFVVLNRREPESNCFNNKTEKCNQECKVTETTILPVRNGEGDIWSVTKNFIYECFRERHIGLIWKSGQSSCANLFI